MLYTIEEDKALALLDSYLTEYSNRGFVKAGITDKYMLYLFLVDFVASVFDYFSEADYSKVNKILAKLFNGSCCLLPYEVSSGHKLTIGLPRPMSNSRVRISEVGRVRETEDENLRVARL